MGYITVHEDWPKAALEILESVEWHAIPELYDLLDERLADRVANPGHAGAVCPSCGGIKPQAGHEPEDVTDITELVRGSNQARYWGHAPHCALADQIKGLRDMLGKFPEAK